MIKSIGVGIWAALIALGAHFGVTAWLQKKAAAAAAAAEHGPAEALETKKATLLNVPIVVAGEMQGYIVVQLAYVVDSAAQKAAKFNPEPFVLDEGFRAIYSDKKIDLKNLERYDLDGLRKQILDRVKARLKSDLVRDVMLHEFNYVLKSDLRQ